MSTLLRTCNFIIRQTTRSYMKDIKGREIGCVYYDFNDGERKSSKEALKRFYRLHWGGWIHAKPGRKNKMWRKSWWRLWYDRQHFFCDAKESEALEKLVTPLYKKPRYFVDDPYEPYHVRHGIEFCPPGRKKNSSSYIKLIQE